MKTAALAILITLAPLGASAQDGSPPIPSRMEISGALTLLPSTTGSVLNVAYEPALRLGGTPIESRAHQSLTVDTRSGRGFEIGLAVFPARAAGLQLTFARSTTDVAGTAGVHDSHLRYVSLAPPSYEPREIVYEHTAPWPPATGSLDITTMAIGAVARWTAEGGRFGGRVGGGLAGEHHGGRIESVAYTQFVLGGHSTLFPVTHRVIVAPVENKWAWRPYVAGDVHARVARRAAVYGGLRVTLGTAATVGVGPVRLADPDENPWAPDLTDVAATLGVERFQLPALRWRAVVGLKIFLQ
jgi:hypothetical protein